MKLKFEGADDVPYEKKMELLTQCVERIQENAQKLDPKAET